MESCLEIPQKNVTLQGRGDHWCLFAMKLADVPTASPHRLAWQVPELRCRHPLSTVPASQLRAGGAGLPLGALVSLRLRPRALRRQLSSPGSCKYFRSFFDLL